MTLTLNEDKEILESLYQVRAVVIVVSLYTFTRTDPIPADRPSIHNATQHIAHPTTHPTTSKT